MTLRITSSFVVLLALAGIACSTTAAPPAQKEPSSTQQRPNGDGDDDGDGDSEEEGEPGPGDYEEMTDYLAPFEIHTGFTGGAEVFKVPLETDLEGELTWTVEDPSIADVAPMDAPPWYEEMKQEEPDAHLSFAMLTAKKAGKTKVTVSNGQGKSFSSDVTVTAYTSAAYAIGQKRYKTGETDARQPCAGCHESNKAPEHSPWFLAELSDENLLKGIQQGYFEWEDFKYELNNGDHKWNLTEDEKTGVLAYLRGIDPDKFQW